jgi:hypothetical protein
VTAATAAADTAATATANDNEYICSSLVTIINPDDIGWQVGEILFKLIMRYGSKVNISIAATTEGAKAELFEYQTHQWSARTTIHSLIYGDNKPVWIQYTPPATDPAAPSKVIITIHYENQFTGEKYTYVFEHDIHDDDHDQDHDHDHLLAPATATIIAKTIQILLGMIQIEIFKQFREIESDRYDKDTIVSEAYKTMRMLRTVEAMTRTEYPTLLCQTLNLMTDVKVIIGLTTIQDIQAQNIIIHARRTCSAENDFFNTGASLSRKYVENEEQYEEDAKQVIKAATTAAAATAAAAQETAGAAVPVVPEEDEECDYRLDGLPSIIPSRFMTQQVTDTPFYGTSHKTGSELRALCVKIAVARANNEDITAEQLYEQMLTTQRHHYYDYNEVAYDGPRDNDVFSSTPMDDEYTQRRMGMMRQMS